MAVEILKKPELLIESGTAHHVMAVERRTIEGEEVRVSVGEVAVSGTTHKRWLEDSRHSATRIEARVGDENIYEKKVANTGPFTSLVYGLRIGLARRKAARHVKSALK